MSLDRDIRRICNRGHQERGFVIATNLSVLRSGALNHRLPYAFSVLDELWTSSFTRFLRTERHLIMAGRLSTVETAAATDFPNFGRENIRYRCNRHKVRGQQVNYKSAEKYIGSDTFELIVLFPGGFTREVHLNIDVRSTFLLQDR